MMWAAISHTGKTALVHIPGNLTAQRYCDEILQLQVLPLMQQNGARPASRRRLRTVWCEILHCPGIAAAVDVAVVHLSRK
jgi:hypothetical protein